MKNIGFVSYFVFSIIMYAYPKNIYAKSGTIKIHSSLRYRYECFTNRTLKKVGTGTSDHILFQRLSLSLGYSFPSFKLFTELYDSRFWFNDLTVSDFDPVCPHQNLLDLKQLYIQWNKIAGSSIGIKIGRQLFKYGDMRVWGPGAWRNAVRYRWDAAKLLFDLSLAKIDLIYGRLLLTDPDILDVNYADPHCFGLYGTLKNLFARMDLFYTASINPKSVAGESGSITRQRHTVGVYLNAKKVKWDYSATLFVQAGRMGADDVLAFAGAAETGYSLAFPFNPQISCAYAYASGDAQPDDGISGTFDGLFGAAANYYGKMNLFFLKNLHNPHVDLKIFPFRKTSMVLSYHHFFLASKTDAWYKASGKPHRRDKSGLSGSEIGGEIDLTFSARMIPKLKIQGGMSHLFAGRFIRETANPDPGINGKGISWAFFQTILNY